LSRLTFIYLVFFSVTNTFAQSIYKGGNGDGFSTNCYVQASNSALSIYNGGNADGFSTLCYVQNDNIALSIYSGGNADGFSTLCYVQNDNPSLSIYSGGNADGFSTLCYLQNDNPSLNIYYGGNSDGFSTSCYLQNDNTLLNIYKGGIADGYGVGCAGTQANPIPLPIELISFTGQCESRNVILKWSTATETNNDFFTIEKSMDGATWEIAGKLPGAVNSYTQKNYTFTDNNSYGTITTYYRLKQTNTNGSYSYTGILYVDNCNNNYNGFSVYPNPNNGEFIILAKQITDNTSLEIYNNLGQLVNKTTLKETSTKISLASEAIGIYQIMIMEDGSKVFTAKIIKQ
jgi:hypothetical protein